MTPAWLALTRALLNVNFGFSALRHQIRRRHRVWEPILVGVSILVGVGGIAWLAASFATVIVEAGAQLGQPELALTFAHLIAAMVVFFFGVAFVMSSFYFSDDAALLMSWPLRPRHIVAAKFVTILVSEYLTIALILGPVYFVYARDVPVSGWFYLIAPVVFLLTPVAPLALAAVLVVVLMRFVSFTRKRDFMTMVGGLLGLALAIGFQYLAQTQADMSEEELMRLISGSAYGISQLMARGFPPVFWSTLALGQAGTAQGFAALGGTILAAAVSCAALLAVGESLFLRTAQASREGSGRRAKGAVSWGALSPVRSVARAEWKSFIRTPVFVLNGFAGLLIIPIVLVLSRFGSDGDSISRLIDAGVLNVAIGIVVIWGWLTLAAGLSVIPATAVSREGPTLWIHKTLPLSGREFFLGKLLGTEAMILGGSIPGVLVFAYVMKLPLASLLLGTLLGTITSILVSMACLTVDMLRPWLTWTEPARAIKSNLNGLIGMLVSLVLVGLPAWLGVILGTRGMPFYTVIAVIAALNVLALAGLWLWLSPRLDRWMRRLGD